MQESIRERMATSRARSSGSKTSATPGGTRDTVRRDRRKGAAPAARDAGPEAAPETQADRLDQTDAGGTRTYHDDTHRIVAVTGPAAAIRALRHEGYRDFDVYRSADGGLYMLLRFDLGIEALAQAIAESPPLDGAGWTRITAAALRRFLEENGTQTG
jgi:hypothetical protein